MKVEIKLDPYPEVPWDSPDTPPVAALWRRFNELFAGWKPRRMGKGPKSGGYRYHALEADIDDARFEQVFAAFKQEVEKSNAARGDVDVDLTPAEMKRARYIEFGARSLENPEEELSTARNVYPALCRDCGFPDLSKVPSPYWVSKEVRKRPKEDMFTTPEGLLIVRPAALEVLRAAIDPEIEFGPALVAGEKSGKLAHTDRLWWVRPLHTIAPTQAWYVQKRCPKCKRPVHAHFNPPISKSTKLADWGPRVPTYGQHGANLV